MILATLICFAAPASAGAAQEDKWRVMWLALHAPFHVWVRPLPPDEESVGLTEELLRQLAEHGLRRNGIEVSSESLPVGQPRLNIAIDMKQVDANRHAVSWSISLLVGQIIRGSTGKDFEIVQAIIWGQTALSIMPTVLVPTVLAQALPKLVDKLSVDYHAAKADYQASRQ